MDVSIPLLGKVELEPAADGRWAFQLDYLGHAVDLDFNIEEDRLTQSVVDAVARFIADLAKYDALARQAIRDTYDKGGEYSVQLYVRHHLEQMNAMELRRYFEADDPQAIDPHVLLSKLCLRRIGLYPEYDDQPAIYDYKFGEIPTDYVVAVSFDPAGKPVAVDMES